MKGKLESVAEIKQLKTGTGKDGNSWTLWGTTIQVDGKKFGFSNFEKSKLENKIKEMPLGSVIEFETDQRGRYTNVKQDTEITVHEKGDGKAPPKQAAPAQQDIKIPTEEETVFKANKLAEKMMDQIDDDPAFVLKARTEVFRELMLDRRTLMIQGFKQSNMAAFRGD